MLEPFISFLTVLILTPFFIKLGSRLSLTGTDIHKPDKPLIPKTGGLAIILGVSLGVVLSLLLGGGGPESIAFLLSALIAALIGFVEDVRGEMDPRLKPLLLVFCAAPILFLGTYIPRPHLPFIGGTRLTKIYPFLILAGFPIVSNAVNSIDVLNGSMAYTSITFFAATLAVAWLRGTFTSFTLSAIMLAALIAFTIYNKYPAKVFAGNSGSLFVGASMTAVAIIGRMEVAAIIALLPHIMNEMHVIFSMRGLRSAKKLRARPVEISGNELTASADRGAPITLVRILSAGIRLREPQVVMALTLLSAYSAFLAVLTEAFFIGVRVWPS